MKPILFERQPVVDERGFFLEAFNEEQFSSIAGREVRFVQDNHSRSIRGALRGLHYQVPPAGQGKLVRVSRGVIFDVAVDVRRSSPDFGVWTGYELSDSNFRQLWVPEGFAHGFLTLSESADVLYKTTAYYSPSHQRTVRWDDPAIGIEWPLQGARPVVSARDATAPMLADAESFG